MISALDDELLCCLESYRIARNTQIGYCEPGLVHRREHGRDLR
jgi:hypothetical protein